jgi:hypothetical protein
MPREMYKNNVAYLFKLKQLIKGGIKAPSWETDGTAFYCDKATKTSSLQTHMAGQYSVTTDTVLKTTTQLDYTEGDRIAFTPTPISDVNNDDYTVIKSVNRLPLLQKGAKHRNKEYYDFRITTT